MGVVSIRNKILSLVRDDKTIPSTESVANRLLQQIQRGEDIFKLAKTVKSSPSITANVLKISNSAIYGSQLIRSAEEAVFRLGTQELGNLAQTIGIMERVAHLKVKVNWKTYWLHCLLTARVTELIAAAFRPISGKEYLCGLLHDIGKLFMEHHFPSEFDQILLRAMERKISFYQAECQLFDITHAEVGAALAKHWHLDGEIVRSIHYHHDPLCPLNKDPQDVEYEKFLALDVSVADTLANMFHVNIQGIPTFKSADLEEIPAWQSLKKFPALHELDIDFANEISLADATIQSIEKAQ